MAELNTDCLTCVQPSGPEFLTVQNEIEEALQKHFWFTEADIQWATICLSCWNQVKNFHQFYISVEEVYHSRTASVIVKSELDGFACLEDVQQEELENFNLFNAKAEGSVGPAADDVRPKFSDENTKLVSECSQLNIEAGLLENFTEEPAGEFFEQIDDKSDSKQSDYERDDDCVEEGLSVGNVKMYQNLRVVLSDCMAEGRPEVCSASSKRGSCWLLQDHVEIDHQNDSEYTSITKKRRSSKECRMEEANIEGMDIEFEHVPDDETYRNPQELTITKSEPEMTKETELLEDVHEDDFAEPADQIVEQIENQSDSCQSDDEPDGMVYAPKKRKRGRLHIDKKEDDDYIRTHVKYICEHCGYDSPTFNAYKSHSQLKHGIKSPFLLCCGTKYVRKYFLIQHVQVVNNPDKFRCQECEKSFKNREGYKHHMTAIHSLKKPVHKCERCPKTFHSKFRLKVHLQDHANWENQTWRCTQCGKTFTDGDSLNGHIAKCLSGSSPCGICSLVLPSQVALEAHNFQEHGPFKQQMQKKQTLKVTKNVPEACSSDNTYVESNHPEVSGALEGMTAEMLVEQSKEEHNSEQSEAEQADKDQGDLANASVKQKADADNVKSASLQNRMSDNEYIRTHVKLICNECGLDCLTFFELKEHARLTHRNLSPSIFCCGRMYSKKYLLFSHVQLVNNPAAFRCDECDKNFTGPDILRRHLRMFHTTHAFRCHRCTKTFHIADLLEEHLQHHDNQDTERWKCTACNKVYQDGKTLNLHINRLHPGWPEFICDLCSRPFRLGNIHKLRNASRGGRGFSKLLRDVTTGGGGVSRSVT